MSRPEDEFYALLAAQRERDEHLTALLEGTPRRRLVGQLILDAHCPQRCELLVVYSTRFGRVGYIKGFKLSPDKTERDTAPAARATRTTDGYRRWKGRAFPIDAIVNDKSGQLVGLPLRCNELYGTLPREKLADWLRSARPGAPVRVTVGASDLV